MTPERFAELEARYFELADLSQEAREQRLSAIGGSVMAECVPSTERCAAMAFTKEK